MLRDLFTEALGPQCVPGVCQAEVHDGAVLVAEQREGYVQARRHSDIS